MTTPVFVFSTCTLAFEIAAPDWSVTRPLIEPETAWALAICIPNRRTAAHVAPIRKHVMAVPFFDPRYAKLYPCLAQLSTLVFFLSAQNRNVLFPQSRNVL